MDQSSALLLFLLVAGCTRPALSGSADLAAQADAPDLADGAVDTGIDDLGPDLASTLGPDLLGPTADLAHIPTWTEVSIKNAYYVDGKFVGLAGSTLGDLYVLLEHAIFHSTDGGLSFTRNTTADTLRNLWANGSEIYRIGNEFSVSHDRGATWTLIADEAPDGFAQGLELRAIGGAGTNVYVGGDSGLLLISRDSGHTWTSTRTTGALDFTGIFASDALVVAFSGKQSKTGTDVEGLRSTDQGSTWSTIGGLAMDYTGWPPSWSGTASDVWTIDTLDPQTVGSYPVHSRDGALTWSAGFTWQLGKQVNVVWSDSSNVLAAGGMFQRPNGWTPVLWISGDDGATWTEASPSAVVVPNSAEPFNAMFVSAPDDVWLVGATLLHYH